MGVMAQEEKAPGEKGSKLLAVVRVRGQVNVPRPVRDTLAMLGLHKNCHATLVDDRPAYLGMLRKAQVWITWGEIDLPTLVELLRRRGRLVGNKPITDEYAQKLGFKNLEELAKAIVRDGEGATHFVEITVQGARTPAEAKQVGMSVARSPLVKTAIYGEDANWGRIICAVGYSGVPIEPEKVRLWLGDLELVRGGKPYHIDEERASQLLSQRDISIIIDLGMGQASTTVWTCDLSHEYVNINAHYRT